ncbi:hypothetical protein CKO51_00470 [Rhodopirellula sp. SM50]|nr:hypothetical protein CKO51_00470 [Rhodopirellula sp. SM50]
MANTIKVFGSAMVRVPPDVASIRVMLSRIEQEPSAAFASAHSDAKKIHDYLKSFGVDDVCSSRINLSRAEEYRSGESRNLCRGRGRWRRPRQRNRGHESRHSLR